jgi:hypothetical protein
MQVDRYQVMVDRGARALKFAGTGASSCCPAAATLPNPSSTDDSERMSLVPLAILASLRWSLWSTDIKGAIQVLAVRENTLVSKIGASAALG